MWYRETQGRMQFSGPGTLGLVILECCSRLQVWKVEGREWLMEPGDLLYGKGGKLGSRRSICIFLSLSRLTSSIISAFTHTVWSPWPISLLPSSQASPPYTSGFLSGTTWGSLPEQPLPPSLTIICWVGSLKVGTMSFLTIITPTV